MMESTLPLIDGCHWLPALTPPLGRAIESWPLSRLLGFEPLRLFWLTEIGEGQWRGRHAHRVSRLATFAVNGGCNISLDNGYQVQTIRLNEQSAGVMIDPYVWHELCDFSMGAAILVVASTLYTEEDYIRDYDAFRFESRMKAG